MKTEKNILIAFVLNLLFAIIEFVGGAVTGSVAILSDAVHDMGDSAGIGVSFFLERKSKKQPDGTYTYGYTRYSVVGSTITTLILIVGSVTVVYNAVYRLFHPAEIHYDGMILFAVIGTVVNFAAAWFTKGSASLNQKAVNLHMLEDVLGWLVVLLGAVIMRFTDLSVIDPVMSIAVAAFILFNALKNIRKALDVFLEKTPCGINVEELQAHLEDIDGVQSVHHIHIWSMDGQNNYATMHVVTAADGHTVKEKIREELKEHGIGHATLELEAADEHCHEEHCHIELKSENGHHHHHH